MVDVIKASAQTERVMKPRILFLPQLAVRPLNLVRQIETTAAAGSCQTAVRQALCAKAVHHRGRSPGFALSRAILQVHAAGSGAVRWWIGNVNQKREPLPGSDSRPICPPWSSTSLRAIDRPRPVPP